MSRIIFRRSLSSCSNPKPSLMMPSFDRTPVNCTPTSAKRFRLRCPAIQVKDFGAQDGEMDLPIRTRQFEHRLIKTDHHSRYRPIKRIFNGAVDGAERNRAHQQPQQGAAYEEQQGGKDRSEDPGGAPEIPDQHRYAYSTAGSCPSHLAAVRGGAQAQRLASNLF